MWVNNSEFVGEDNNEIDSCRYSFVTFLYNFEFVLVYLYFPRDFFEIIYEDLLNGCYSLPFELSGKVLQVTLTLFISFIFYIPTISEWRKQKIIYT